MKMEIELTDEQAEKVEILKENGIEVGEAIEILFDMKDAVIEHGNDFFDHRINKAHQEKAELEEKLAQVEDEIELYNKLKGSALNPIQKQKIIVKEYGNVEKSYDETVQDQKHKFKWSNDIFKF
ncbi:MULTISPECIES: hypothetical protein [unclassified Methanobrevibacter]|uniref:hypothetical protein n=1 Tax=unclassified Methanobrevibacter TaxID=2638681 RepID=UPI0027339012|nr:MULTISPECIES: hypothetical protein [unclassified Methanobrevibacter]